jgi:hypothetical protein
MPMYLDFTQLSQQPDVWKSELPTLTYSIYSSPSGFLVHCGRKQDGETEDAPMEGAPLGLFPSFAAAIAACEEHNQRWRVDVRTR